MIHIRPGRQADLNRLMEIFAHARTFMASTGNANQWIDGYPSRELMAREIADGHCHVCEDEEGKIAATFCLVPGPDPFYATIEDGKWLDDEPYHAIHRIASDGSRKGIGQLCLEWCARQCPSLRADTHRDNRIMQHLLERNGFVRCGTVHVANGTPRIAYQKPQTAGTPWFIFYKDQLLLRRERTEAGGIVCRVPCGAEPPLKPEAGCTVQSLSLPSGGTAHTFAISRPAAETEEWTLVNLRSSYEYISTDEYNAAGKASQILYWDRHSRFCPACGTAMEQQTPIMKKCPACAHELYPPISPAIIVLIRRGDEILLVHARNFRGTFYGLVAGFLEAGETLEQCVRREVMEETGLKVRNITYFGSQPWPYPSGLMVGFTADYESGEIKLQQDELSAGAFYSKDNLPEIPQKLSIARKMIDWWLEKGYPG